MKREWLREFQIILNNFKSIQMIFTLVKLTEVLYLKGRWFDTNMKTYKNLADRKHFREI